MSTATTARVRLRVPLTVAWTAVVFVLLRWWEITLRAPSVMVWTVVLIGIHLAGAWLAYRDGLRDGRHPAWRRAALWAGLAVVVWLGVTLVPQVRLGDQPVRTVVMVGLLDAVISMWIALSALATLWTGYARLAVLAVVPTLLAGAGWLFVIQMPGASFRDPLRPLSLEEAGLRTGLMEHLVALSVTIGERSDRRPAAAHEAAAYIERTLVAMGAAPVSQPFENAGDVYRNLIVEVAGTMDREAIVVVGAHYDTAEDAPGADDNASGTAALLELVRTFHRATPARTLRFVFFANEEPPFFNTEWMGSAVYAAEAARRGDRIEAMVSLETIGYYREEAGSQRYPPPFSFFYPDRGDFIGFVGNLSSRRLVRRAIATFRSTTDFPSEGAAAPGWVPGVGWSDHQSFWRHGVRAIMITDTAPFRNPYYHTRHDTLDQLDIDRMTRVVRGIMHVVDDLANASGAGER